MFVVYIIKNDLTEKYYTGSTNNFERRLSEHNRHQTKSTKSKGMWYLIYMEEYNSNIDAIRRERKIKSFKGGNAFRRLISS